MSSKKLYDSIHSFFKIGKYNDPANMIKFVNPTNEKEFAKTIKIAINTKNDNSKEDYNLLRRELGNHSDYVDQIEKYLFSFL